MLIGEFIAVLIFTAVPGHREQLAGLCFNLLDFSFKLRITDIHWVYVPQVIHITLFLY